MDQIEIVDSSEKTSLPIPGTPFGHQVVEETWSQLMMRRINFYKLTLIDLRFKRFILIEFQWRSIIDAIIKRLFTFSFMAYPLSQHQLGGNRHAVRHVLIEKLYRRVFDPPGWIEEWITSIFQREIFVV